MVTAIFNESITYKERLKVASKNFGILNYTTEKEMSQKQLREVIPLHSSPKLAWLSHRPEVHFMNVSMDCILLFQYFTLPYFITILLSSL